MENIIAKFYNQNEIVIHPNAEAPVILKIDGIEFECPIHAEVGKKYIKLPSGMTFAKTMNFKISWPGQREVHVDNFDMLKDSQVFVASFHDDQPIVKATDKRTTFKLFAPTALSVTLRHLGSKNKITEFEMTRKENGVWEKSIAKKLIGYFQFKVTKYNGQKEIIFDANAHDFKNENWSIVQPWAKASKASVKSQVDHNSVIVQFDLKNIKNKELSYLYDTRKDIKYIHGPKYFKYIGATHMLVRGIFDYESNRPFALKHNQTYEEFDNFVNAFGHQNIGTIVEIKLEGIIKALHSVSDLETFFEPNKALMLAVEMAQDRIIDSVKKLVSSFAISGLYITEVNAVSDELIQKVVSAVRKVRKNLIIISDTKLTDETVVISNDLKKLVIGEGADTYGIATGSAKATSTTKNYFNTLRTDETIKLNRVLYSRENALERLARTNKPEIKNVHIARARIMNAILALSNNAKVMNIGDELISDSMLFTWEKVATHKDNVIWFVELARIIENLKSYLNGYIESETSYNGSMIINQFKLRGDNQPKVIVIINPSINQYYFSTQTPFVQIFNDFGAVDEKTKMDELTVEPLSVEIIAMTDAEKPQLMTLHEIIEKKDKMLKIPSGDDCKQMAAAKHAEQNIKKEKIEMLDTMYEKIKQTGKKANVVSYKSITDAKARAAKLAKENISATHQEGAKTMAEKQKEALKKMKIKSFK